METGYTSPSGTGSERSCSATLIRLEISSRDGRSLQRYFPELVPALMEHLPKTCVLDGEIVVPGEGALDFDSLQLRIHPAASRIKLLSNQIPASYVAFDLLADGRDRRGLPFAERRARLEKLLRGATVLSGDRDPIGDLKPPPVIAITPQSADAGEANRWFDIFEGSGLDGVIAKQPDLSYRPGERVMVKVKHRRTADCVVGGYRLSKSQDGVGSLLLGLYDETGVLQYVGHTSSFKAKERRELLGELRPLEGGRSFAGGRSPGGPSRWTAARDPSWVPVEPKLVCEVSYDFLQGDRLRHAARFVRWRRDRKPTECTVEQVGR